MHDAKGNKINWKVIIYFFINKLKKKKKKIILNLKENKY